MLIRTVPATGRATAAIATGWQGRLRLLLGGVPVLRADQVMRGLLDARGPLRDLPQHGPAVADQVVGDLRGRADPLPGLDPVGDEQVDQQPAIVGRDRAEPLAEPGACGGGQAPGPPVRATPAAPPAPAPAAAGCGRLGGGEPVDPAVPVHPDRRARPLAPRGRERVRRLDRRVDAADVPPIFARVTARAAAISGVRPAMRSGTAGSWRKAPRGPLPSGGSPGGRPAAVSR